MIVCLWDGDNVGWKTRNDPNKAGFGEHYQERETEYPYGAKRGASGKALPTQHRSVDSMKAPVKAEKLEDSKDYKTGFEKGLQQASVCKYKPKAEKSEAWRKGFDAGWKQGFKKPKYDEVVLINQREDITAWEKRRAVMESEEFQIWLQERYNSPPMPADPYRAFMIDKSLTANLKDRDKWAPRTNRSDWLPVDYPPITDQPAPLPSEPAPKNKEAEKSKKALRARGKIIAKGMNVPETKLTFTVSGSRRARSFYRSGYAKNRLTGEIVKVNEPEIVIGIPRTGKISTLSYATLAHEYGHHKEKTDLENSEGMGAVGKHYAELQTNHKARIANERKAWEHAKPFMKDHPGGQNWWKKYALGTYIGTTPMN